MKYHTQIRATDVRLVDLATMIHPLIARLFLLAVVRVFSKAAIIMRRHRAKMMMLM